MTAVIYARFSTDKQREESIEAQERACREFAGANGHTIISVYADRALSGKTDSRPQFQKMMRDAQAGKFDLVLVHKYNRFARRMSDHVRYEDKLNAAGVQLVAVAENFGTGKEAVIMKALMRSMSEYYIIDLSDEVKKGHKENALKALHNGGFAPFGYDVVDQKYVINALEAKYVRKMFDCAASQGSFDEIIKEMADIGLTGKRGRPIQYSQIYDILRNEKYTGTYLYSPEQESSKAAQRDKPNAIRIDNAFPPIITKEQYKEVQSIMDSRKHAGRRSKYMCSRLVYCGKCGAPMHGITTRQYRYFYCKNHCGNPNVHMDVVDAAALKYLHELLNEDNQTDIAALLRKYQASAKYREQDFYDNVKSQISERQKKYDALYANLSTGALPPEIVADLGEKMRSIKSEIEKLKEMKPDKDFTADQIKTWLASIKAAPTEEAVRLLISKITVNSEQDISMESTLMSCLGILGCGTRIRT